MTHVEFGLIVQVHVPLHHQDHMANLHRLLDAVEGHYASAWCIDHLENNILEGWTALTYLAALHPALQWGHAVLCQSYRNPALLARMASTLQFMTGGRLVLGMGAGGQEAEYLAHGYPFPSPGTRVAELDEALHVIKAMWTEEHPTFEGRHHHIRDARCAPRPDPLPPIAIGAFGPRMLRLTARHADWWNVSSTGMTEYRRLADEFERACDDVGRDPATVRRVWSGGCVCAATDAEVARLAATHARRSGTGADEEEDDFDLVGTPARIIAHMEPFIALGVDCFLLDCGGFPDLTTVETMIDEVLPRLND